MGTEGQKRVFVTGIAGTGKSAVANELRAKGIAVIDVDHVSNLCSWVHKETHEKVDISNVESIDNELIDQYDYTCDTEMLKEMLAKVDDVVVVFGVVDDNSDLLPLFDTVFLLQCSPSVLVQRLQTRDTNNFGKDPAVQQRMLEWRTVFDVMMCDAGAIPINADASLDVVVEELLNKMHLER